MAHSSLMFTPSPRFDRRVPLIDNVIYELLKYVYASPFSNLIMSNNNAFFSYCRREENRVIDNNVRFFFDIFLKRNDLVLYIIFGSLCLMYVFPFILCSVLFFSSSQFAE